MKRGLAILFVVAAALALIGCSSDPLETQNLVFQERQTGCEFVEIEDPSTDHQTGTWDWAYSLRQQMVNECSYSDPKISGFTHTLVFKENGDFEEYRDGKLVTGNRTVSSVSSTPPSLGGPADWRIGPDTMVFNYFAADGPQDVYVRRSED